MNLRATKPKLRVALALALVFACAFVWNTGLRPVRRTDVDVCVPSAPSPRDLPSDCAITAAEAASRLAATGAWTRVMYVSFIVEGSGPVGHAVTIWQMPTSKQVLCYDQFLIGRSLELGTESHDPKIIRRAISKKTGVKILSAHFI